MIAVTVFLIGGRLSGALIFSAVVGAADSGTGRRLSFLVTVTPNICSLEIDFFITKFDENPVMLVGISMQSQRGEGLGMCLEFHKSAVGIVLDQTLQNGSADIVSIFQPARHPGR
jgi:hypothetical protein